MKATKYLVMAAAALAFAACSNEELASVAPKNKSGLKPLEFSTIVQAQTRAQIDASNLTTLYMTTTGTFYDANDAKVIDPTLTLTKSGDNWTYTYNDNTTPGDLYWPLEGTNATFKAWYYDGGSAAGALNNKNADKDAVGAYAAVDYVEGEQTVSLSTYHAVAKAEFKVKVLAKTQGNNSVKIDVKSVCLHNMNYKASAYTMPTSEAQMGAFTVDGTTHRDLITPIATNYTPSFITEGAEPVTKGTMFVLPQTFEVQDLTATTWDKPYISVLAQICIDKDGDSDPIIFPKYAGADDYAWIALPLPSDFTGMEAHKKYVFTINFRNDALGKVDRDQNPNGKDKNGSGEEPNETGDDDGKQPSGPNTNDKVPNGDEGSDIKLGNHSGYPLKVTVTAIDDFGTGAEYNVTNTASGGGSSVPAPEGAINGIFSVSATQKVYFSKGNLQLDGVNTWKFADNQWDYFGNNQSSNHRDLFGWGTKVNPNNTSTSDTNYSWNEWGENTDLVLALGADWRTLTYDQWYYLLKQRTTCGTVFGTSGASYTQAIINTDGTSVKGLILFPDGVNIASNEVATAGVVNYATNWIYATQCTIAQWAALESKGCVFLPAAGCRNGTQILYVGTDGHYWSSTPEGSNQAYGLFFQDGIADFTCSYRSLGSSVRLVYDVE